MGKYPFALAESETGEEQTLPSPLLSTPLEKPKHGALWISLWEVLAFKVKPSCGNIEAKQLVSLRPEDGSRFLLGQVRWVKHGVQTGTEIGVRLIDGAPRKIGVRRPAEDSAASSVFVEGCHHTCSSPPTCPTHICPLLFSPKGWYDEDAILEMQEKEGAGIQSFTLSRLLLSGPNFDQVEYQRTR